MGNSTDNFGDTKYSAAALIIVSEYGRALVDSRQRDICVVLFAAVREGVLLFSPNVLTDKHAAIIIMPIMNSNRLALAATLRIAGMLFAKLRHYIACCSGGAIL